MCGGGVDGLAEGEAGDVDVLVGGRVRCGAVVRRIEDGGRGGGEGREEKGGGELHFESGGGNDVGRVVEELLK